MDLCNSVAIHAETSERRDQPAGKISVLLQFILARRKPFPLHLDTGMLQRGRIDEAVRLLAGASGGVRNRGRLRAICCNRSINHLYLLRLRLGVLLSFRGMLVLDVFGALVPGGRIVPSGALKSAVKGLKPLVYRT